MMMMTMNTVCHPRRISENINYLNTSNSAVRKYYILKLENLQIGTISGSGEKDQGKSTFHLKLYKLKLINNHLRVAVIVIIIKLKELCQHTKAPRILNFGTG